MTHELFIYFLIVLMVAVGLGAIYVIVLPIVMVTSISSTIGAAAKANESTKENHDPRT